MVSAKIKSISCSYNLLCDLFTPYPLIGGNYNQVSSAVVEYLSPLEGIKG
jgi:hypothetical protein